MEKYLNFPSQETDGLKLDKSDLLLHSHGLLKHFPHTVVGHWSINWFFHLLEANHESVCWYRVQGFN